MISFQMKKKPENQGLGKGYGMSEVRFYVGSYAGEREPGIALCSFDPDGGGFSLLSEYAGVINPIYFAAHPGGRVLYTCAETVDGEGAVAAFRIGEGGALSRIKVTGDGGRGCCHVSVNPSGTFLAASNYGDGSLSLFRLEKDGEEPVLTDRVVHRGRSVHWRRQKEAHVHFAMFAGDNELFCCDLGEDRICHYAVDPDSGKLRELGAYHTAAGDGPRHIVLSADGDRIYCITEMGANVTVIDRKSGKNIQRLRSIPEEVDLRKLKVGDFDAYGAAIRITEDGTGILASNRGDDSVSLFRVGERGLLTRLCTEKTGGVMPRDIALCGNLVFAANQGSGSVTVLTLSGDRLLRRPEVFWRKDAVAIWPILQNEENCTKS
ncbi:MAG: lactonase family protein [Lachnospiraceae bacterium]